jgi:hypothetical protein
MVPGSRPNRYFAPEELQRTADQPKVISPMHLPLELCGQSAIWRTVRTQIAQPHSAIENASRWR